MLRFERGGRTLALGMGIAVLLSPIATDVVSSPAEAPTGRTSAPSELPLPARRFAPCGALDADGRRLVVFGGRAEAAITHFSDAWELELDSADGRASWQLSAPAGTPEAPPPTRSCAAAWDRDEHRLLVFGGWDGTAMRNGVWALDPDAGVWTQLCDGLSCGPPPSPRRAAAAAYDSQRDQLVVVGGLDGSSYRNDVWTLSLDASPRWTAVTPTGPAPTPRASHTLTYDGGRDRMWMVGGTTSGSDLGDVWSLDLATMAWSQTTTGCPAGCPSPRSGHVVGFDDELDRLVLYGGLQSTNGHAPPEAWTLGELGEPVPSWHRLDIDSAVPQARFVPVGAFTDRRLIVFGGGLGGAAYRDTVALHVPAGGQPFWRSIAPRTPLTARDQAAATIGEGGVITIFGGFGSGTFPGSIGAGLHLADTWQLPIHGGGRRHWHDVTSSDPERVPLAREAAAAAADRSRGRTFVIGGLNGDASLIDVWTVRARAGSARWTQLCSPTSCGDAPEPRWGAHAVWDADDQRVVLFGGRRSDGSSLSDTWFLELAPSPHWERLDPGTDRPAARWGGAVAYDRYRDRMVLFGGQSGPDAAATPLADTWSLSLGNDPRWTELHPSGPGPSARRSPAYAAVPRFRGVDLLVTTGLHAPSGTHHNDVWRLSLVSADGAWQQLAPDRCGETGVPTCRRSASAVWDRGLGRLVLLFGRDGQHFDDDVWSFDVRARAWSPIATS